MYVNVGMANREKWPKQEWDDIHFTHTGKQEWDDICFTHIAIPCVCEAYVILCLFTGKLAYSTAVRNHECIMSSKPCKVVTMYSNILQIRLVATFLK